MYNCYNNYMVNNNNIAEMNEMTSRFDKSVDENTGFRHSTLLAMPIKHAGSPGKVLGVFQLVNKVTILSIYS